MIQQKYELEYFSSGESLRERVKSDDFTGGKIKAVIEAGIYVPESVICQIWMNKLEDYKNNFPGFNGMVFDGTPRKLMEAELLSLALDWYEWGKNVRVFLINISEKEAFRRLSGRMVCQNCKKKYSYFDDIKVSGKCNICGGDLTKRADDTPESIRARLDEFEKETVPVFEYYDKNGLLTKIDGKGSIEQVHQSILTALKDHDAY